MAFGTRIVISIAGLLDCFSGVTQILIGNGEVWIANEEAQYWIGLHMVATRLSGRGYGGGIGRGWDVRWGRAVSLKKGDV